MAQNAQQKNPRLVISLAALSADEKQIQVRAAVFKNGAPANSEVTFSANGIQKVGAPARPDPTGVVLETLSTPPDAVTVQVSAEAEGVVKTITVPISKAAAPKKDPPQVRLVTERTRIGPGHYRVNFVVVDPKERGVDCKLRLVSSADFTIDGTTADRHKFEVAVPAEGANLELQFQVPLLEMDVYVGGSSAKVQLEFHGPKAQQQPAGPQDGLLRHLTDGWR